MSSMGNRVVEEEKKTSASLHMIMLGQPPRSSSAPSFLVYRSRERIALLTYIVKGGSG